jgi:hypothetical protein
MTFFKHPTDIEKCQQMVSLLQKCDLCSIVDKNSIREIAIYATGKLIDCENKCSDLSMLELWQKEYQEEYVEDWVYRVFCKKCCGQHWPSCEENMRSCNGDECTRFVWKPWISENVDYGDFSVWHCPQCYTAYCGLCVQKYARSAMYPCCHRTQIHFEWIAESIQHLNMSNADILNVQSRETV